MISIFLVGWVPVGMWAKIPEGAWLLFAILRFFVGVGLTAAVTPSLTVVVELTPTRHRTIATSFYVVFASAGGFLAPAISAAINMGHTAGVAASCWAS